MSGTTELLARRFGIADYVVFAISLILSASIGKSSENSPSLH